MNDRSDDDLCRKVSLLQKGMVLALGVSIVALVIALCSIFYPPITDHRIAQALSQSSGFHELSTKDKITEASVILRTENVEGDGILVPVIAEILKFEDGTEFYYDVGDEYPGGRRKSGAADFGDGQVVFLRGSTASFVYGASYRGKRVGSLGGMTLEALRGKIVGQGERGPSE